MIHIVGCNHGIQPGESIFTALDSVECQEQRAHFRELLQQILTHSAIQFIGEEWGDVETTIAERLADNLEIPWQNINTTEEDKQNMGIPPNYAHGPYSNEQKAAWNCLREQFMWERVQDSKGHAQNLLVICGFAHLQHMTELFGQGGTPVEPIDYKTRDWYLPGIFPEDP
jgi:hypothetical protein